MVSEGERKGTPNNNIVGSLLKTNEKEEKKNSKIWAAFGGMVS